MATLEEAITVVSSLNNVDREILLSKFTRTISEHADIHSAFSMVNELHNKESYHCIYCGFKHVRKNGKKVLKDGSKRQRFYCCECHKTFTDTADSPLYRMRKYRYWLEFLGYLLLGFSLRKIREQIGTGLDGKYRVSLTTLSYWRHKVLDVLPQIDLWKLVGKIQMDETYVLQGQKGVTP